MYLGTPQIAVPPLRALVEAGFDVPLVVTGVDKRRGRGKELSPSPVKAAALELADGPPPAGRAMEAWFHDQTEAGKTVMAARAAIKDQDAPFPVWFYMAPAHR